MDKEYLKIIVGYSGFILYEECYEYNEDACYIADSKEIAEKFMLNCGYNKSHFRVDQISLNDLITDYGCSSGEFAMEKEAFINFQKIAEKNKIEYEFEEYYLDPTLIVVNI